jgi:AraC-like DNA-binding protein
MTKRATTQPRVRELNSSPVRLLWIDGERTAVEASTRYLVSHGIEIDAGAVDTDLFLKSESRLPVAGKPLMKETHGRRIDVVKGLVGQGPALRRDESTSLFAWALADPNLTLCECLALAGCLRLIVKSVGTDSSLAGQVIRIFDRIACLEWNRLDVRLRKVASIIEESGMDWNSLRAEQVATAIDSHVSTVWRVLQTPLGLTFRSLTRGIVMRRAIRELAYGDDHVRQIAFRLGYDYHTSFDRDFKRFLLISPRRYRVMLSRHIANASQQQSVNKVAQS